MMESISFDRESLADCIQCGECTSVCPRHRFDPGFNPRKWMSRLQNVPLQDLIEDRSIWSCLKCFRCADKCRRLRSPAEELMKMRRIMMQYGSYRNTATRHADAFIHDIRSTGKLDEAFLPLKTLQFKIYKLLPMAARMLMKGKLPPLKPERIEQHESLEQIFSDFHKA
jgi:heterodisulfide reductase subunit C